VVEKGGLQQQHFPIQQIFARNSLSISFVRDDTFYRVGDILQLDLSEIKWRIDEIEEDLGVRRLNLSAIPSDGIVIDLGQYDGSGRSILSLDLRSGFTLLEVLNLPVFTLANSDAPVIAVAAAGSEIGWRRASLFNRGANITTIGQTALPSTLGTIADPISGASPYIVDEYNRPKVRLANDNMSLSMQSGDKIPIGNYAMIGQEVIQFREAKILSDGRYELIGLLRGVGGTEEFIAQTKHDTKLNLTMVLIFH